MNLAMEMLHHASASHGERNIVSLYEGELFTLNDYELLIQEALSGLDDAGFRRDTAAILMMDDSPAAIAVFLGCIKYGVSPLICDKRTAVETMQHLLSVVQPEFIVVDKDPCSGYPPCIEQFATVEVMLKAANRRELDFTYRSPERKEAPAYVDSKTVAYLGLTSGSSGLPKVVMHGHSEMDYASRHFAVETLRLSKGNVLYSVPKMSFTYGLANSLFFPFYSGASAVLSPSRFEVGQCFQIIDDFNVTHFFAVPSVYKELLRSASFSDEKRRLLRNMQMSVSAGEALSAELSQEWREATGNYIADSVGCSETGSAFLVNLCGNEKLGSVGRAVPGYSLKLFEDGADEESKSGILHIKSCSNALGYLNDPVATAEKFRNGWVVSGDCFEVDDDGYYWFLGRSDNLIKYNGMWVAPSQIETMICDYPGINDCAVFSVERFGNKSIAAAICVNDGFSAISGLNKYLSQKLEGYKLPRVFRIVEELPLNINGKTDLQALRQNASRLIITIDGLAKTGKSTVAKRLASRYGLSHINAGAFFRFIAWALGEGIIAENDLRDDALLSGLLSRSALSGEVFLFEGRDISIFLKGHDRARRAAEIAVYEGVQKSVMAHVRRETLHGSVVVEGRSMGAYLYPDADIKFFFEGSPESIVRVYCDVMGLGKRDYEEGVADLTYRNALDANRAFCPTKKAEDAKTICVDGLSNDEVFILVSEHLSECARKHSWTGMGVLTDASE